MSKFFTIRKAGNILTEKTGTYPQNHNYSTSLSGTAQHDDLGKKKETDMYENVKICRF